MQDPAITRDVNNRRQKRWRVANLERARAGANRRYAANPQTALTQVKSRAVQLKTEVLARYGTVCACCSTSEYLSIDHVDGDGAAHRLELYGHAQKGGGAQFYLWLKSNGYPDGYQILCRRCNRSKGDGDHCQMSH